MSEVIKYGLCFGGQSHIMSASIEPYKEINEFLDSLDNIVYDDNLFKSRDSLYFSTAATADASTGKALLLGICLIVPTWAGNKFLDAIYSSIKTEVVNFYSNTQSNITIKQNIGIQYRHIIVVDSFDVVIVIRFFANNPTELDVLLKYLESISINAQAWLEKYGKKAEIHEYTVENRKVDILPNLYNDLNDIDKDDLKKNMKFIKTKIHTVK